MKRQRDGCVKGGGVGKNRQDREVVKRVCVCDISLCNRAANLRRRKKQRKRDDEGAGDTATVEVPCGL